MAHNGARTNQNLELAGACPQLATAERLDTGSAQQLAAGRGGRANNRGRINLSAVADVLAEYGLDPAEELAVILTKREPVLDRNNQPVLDPKTGEPLTKPALDIDTRVKVHTELLQYTRPKLKAVEVTVKEPELTDDQIEKRLQALMARNEKKNG